MSRRLGYFALAALAISSAGQAREIRPPAIQSAAQWESQQPELRADVLRRLAFQTPTAVPAVENGPRQDRPGYTLQRISFTNRAGQTVPGAVLIPADHVGRGPAVLYHHDANAQGKQESLQEGDSALGFATGEELARAGYVVMVIDARGFGERRQTQSRQAAWSRVVQDDLQALAYLLSRRDVDPERVAALGIGSGAMRARWVAALDDRVAMTIAVAPRVASSATGVNAPDDETLHKAVAALIAPRAHYTLNGAGTESPAVADYQRDVYALFDVAYLSQSVAIPTADGKLTARAWRQVRGWLWEEL